MERPTHRILIVVAEELVGEELIRGIGDRAKEAELRLVAPALTGSALKHAMGDVDDAAESAQERLEHSVSRLEEEGVHVTASVGDSDPVLAIQDALAEFSADEILIVTRTDDDARWLEDDLFERAKKTFEQPITHVELTAADSDDSQVADVERAGAGLEYSDAAAIDPESRNLPKLTLRDLAGILVAVAGTVILVVLAANCGDDSVTTLQREAGTDGEGTDGGCVARNVIAGAAALVNLAHIVGLMLFASVGYRGGWERMFALLSLIGTPVAIIASLLVG